MKHNDDLQHRPSDLGMKTIDITLSILADADNEALEYLGITNEKRDAIVNKKYVVATYLSHGEEDESICTLGQPFQSNTEIQFSYRFESKPLESQISSVAYLMFVDSERKDSKNKMEEATDVISATTLAGAALLTPDTSVFIAGSVLGATALGFYNNATYNQEIRALQFGARMKNYVAQGQIQDTPVSTKGKSKNPLSYLIENTFQRFARGSVGKNQREAIFNEAKKDAFKNPPPNISKPLTDYLLNDNFKSHRITNGDDALRRNITYGPVSHDPYKDPIDYHLKALN